MVEHVRMVSSWIEGAGQPERDLEMLAKVLRQHTMCRRRKNRSSCGLVKGTSALTADAMANEVELAHLDLRYESFRLKQSALEERLLASIASAASRSR